MVEKFSDAPLLANINQLIKLFDYTNYKVIY